MNEKKKNEFLEIYRKLPISIQDFLASDKVGVIIDDVLNLARISSEKFSSIMDLITEVLSFQLSKDQFRSELETRANIPPVAAQIIDKIIQEKIFKIFEKELNQYKPQPIALSIVPEKKTESQEFSKTTPLKTIPSQKQELPSKTGMQIPVEQTPIETTTEQITPDQEFPEQIIPEYSFPEPSEVKVEKPVSKVGELKKVVSPKVSPEQQEKIEVITKKEAMPDFSLPEIQEIKIERPVNRTGELKRVIVPSISPEAQEKIHSKLMEAMNKKEAKPKIVEEMKKVVIEGIKKTPQQKLKPKTIQETEESITSQVIGGEGKQFIPEGKTPKSFLEKPYIFDVKLKEETEKKENLPKGEIKYQRPSDKPFGEA